MVEAMVFVLRTGIPWRNLPALFGKWSTVYSRWRRWTASGVWARVLRAFGSFARGTTRFADSTHIKLHQHAANPAGGQSSQSIGRTKGGLNTKLTALVDSHGRPVSLSLHCGQQSDIHTIQSHICLLRGRTLVADKGFDADSLRASVSTTGGSCSIPRRRGCNGSRPFSSRLYRRRHRVEDFFAAIKRHRRISTRYEKFASTFCAFVQLASILFWLGY